MPPRTALELLEEVRLSQARHTYTWPRVTEADRLLCQEANNARCLIVNPGNHEVIEVPDNVWRANCLIGTETSNMPNKLVTSPEIATMLDQRLRLANEALRAQVADLQKVNKELKAALSKIDNTPLPFSPRHRTLDVRVDQMQEMRAHRIMAGMMFDERTMEEFITNDAMLQEYARQIAKSLRQEAKKLYNRTGSESGQFPF